MSPQLFEKRAGDLMEKIKVTVIIPTYKRPDKLKRAVSSVLNQSFQDFEIIVVDDNEDESYINENQKVLDDFKDLRIKKINNYKNSGACASRNKGIKHSLGNYIAFLDDDDEWTSSFLEETYTLLSNSDNGVGVVYTGFSKFDHRYQVKKDNNGIFYRGDVFLQLLNGWCPISTSLFLIKRDCFNKEVLFDETLPSFQDYDMWLTLSTQYSFEYIDKNLVIKNENEGTAQITSNPHIRERGLNLILEKWGDVITKKLDDGAEERFTKKFMKSIYENKIRLKLQNNKRTDSLKLIKEYITKSNYDLRLVVIFFVSVITHYNLYLFTTVVWHRIKYFNNSSSYLK